MPKEKGLSAGVISELSEISRPTVNRLLVELLDQGKLVKRGVGPAVVYFLAGQELEERNLREVGQGFERQSAENNLIKNTTSGSLLWSAKSQEMLNYLQLPLSARQPVSYKRAFVDSYQPNVTWLLPKTLAENLYARGKSKNNMPAGTYVRKVLEQLLIDLSWASSRLEGNKKSLLDTKELFEKGHEGPLDFETAMLLNHKDAIEFLVDVVPQEGMTVPVIRNLQSILMRDLLSDPGDLGKIRNKVVHIEGAVYVPNQIPNFLQEMLSLIVEKARAIGNPVESAFFLWVNLAYIQPFVDGNKRTSRLASNMPLLLANCAPLSFLNVEQNDYALAMLAVYEKLDTSIAVDLFEHTYNRSIQTYGVVQDSMQAPNPIRVKYREQINQIIVEVVYYVKKLDQVQVLNEVSQEDHEELLQEIKTDLVQLEEFNCSRFRLPLNKTKEWINQGRPF